MRHNRIFCYMFYLKNNNEITVTQTAAHKSCEKSATNETTRFGWIGTIARLL